MSGLQTNSVGRVCESGRQISESRRQIREFGQEISESRRQISESRRQIREFGQEISESDHLSELLLKKSIYETLA